MQLFFIRNWLIFKDFMKHAKIPQNSFISRAAFASGEAPRMLG
jgi:hypothetical protein